MDRNNRSSEDFSTVKIYRAENRSAGVERAELVMEPEAYTKLNFRVGERVFVRRIKGTFVLDRHERAGRITVKKCPKSPVSQYRVFLDYKIARQMLMGFEVPTDGLFFRLTGEYMDGRPILTTE